MIWSVIIKKGYKCNDDNGGQRYAHDFHKRVRRLNSGIHLLKVLVFLKYRQGKHHSDFQKVEC